jgi:hypothetical protein
MSTDPVIIKEYEELVFQHGREYEREKFLEMLRNDLCWRNHGEAERVEKPQCSMFSCHLSLVLINRVFEGDYE